MITLEVRKKGLRRRGSPTLTRLLKYSGNFVACFEVVSLNYSVLLHFPLKVFFKHLVLP